MIMSFILKSTIFIQDYCVHLRDILQDGVRGYSLITPDRPDSHVIEHKVYEDLTELFRYQLNMLKSVISHAFTGTVHCIENMIGCCMLFARKNIIGDSAVVSVDFSHRAGKGSLLG